MFTVNNGGGMKYLLTLCLLLASCSSYLTIKDTSKTFPADYDSIYSEIISFCNRNGVAIRTTDKASGIITTEYSSSSSYRYNFNISSRGDSSTVYLTLYKTSYIGTENPMQYSDYLSDYGKVFSEISGGLAQRNP